MYWDRLRKPKPLMDRLHDIEKNVPVEILGMDYVQRAHPELPVWTITGSGKDFEDRRHKLVSWMLHMHPQSFLRLPEGESKIRGVGGRWKQIGPSAWIVPGDVDIEKLYGVLRDAECGVYTVGREFEPPAFGPDEFRKRLIWLMYADAPLMLENHHWSGEWLLVLNPYHSVGEIFGDRPRKAHREGLETVARFMEILAAGPLLGRDLPDNETIEWFAREVTDDDRVRLIEEGQRILSETDGESVSVPGKSESGNPDGAQRERLRSVLGIFRRVEAIRGGEERLLKVVEEAARALTIDLFRKRIAASVEGIQMLSPAPYESDVRVRITFSDKEKGEMPIDSQIEMLYIPIFRDGIRIKEQEVRENVERALRTSLSIAPYYKLYGIPRPTIAVGWPIYVLAIFVSLFGLYLIIASMWLLFWE